MVKKFICVCRISKQAVTTGLLCGGRRKVVVRWKIDLPIQRNG
jgi:hypothetical protein